MLAASTSTLSRYQVSRVRRLPSAVLYLQKMMPLFDWFKPTENSLNVSTAHSFVSDACVHHVLLVGYGTSNVVPYMEEPHLWTFFYF